MKVRSMVGLIPLFAVQTLEPELLERLPNFKRRLEWFIENRRDLRGGQMVLLDVLQHVEPDHQIEVPLANGRSRASAWIAASPRPRRSRGLGRVVGGDRRPPAGFEHPAVAPTGRPDVQRPPRSPQPAQFAIQDRAPLPMPPVPVLERHMLANLQRVHARMLPTGPRARPHLAVIMQRAGQVIA